MILCVLQLKPSPLKRVAMSNEPSIEQMNEVIGIFMGGKWVVKRIAGRNHRRFYISETLFNFVKNTLHLNYHKSWDELMPVWEKAGGIMFEIRGDLTDKKYLEAHRITKAFIDACQKVEINLAFKAVYDAIQFIIWYNQQKQNDDN